MKLYLPVAIGAATLDSPMKTISSVNVFEIRCFVPGLFEDRK
jgi:hypothetical protein